MSLYFRVRLLFREGMQNPSQPLSSYIKDEDCASECQNRNGRKGLPAPLAAPLAPPPQGPVARRRDASLVSTSVCAEPGRGTGWERKPAAIFGHLGPHGAVARLCLRGFPGAGGGVRLLVGASAAELRAALAVELFAAWARVPGTWVP